MNPLAQAELDDWRATFPGKTPASVFAMMSQTRDDCDVLDIACRAAIKEIALLKESRAAAVDQEQLSRNEANRLRGELAALKKKAGEK